MDTDTQHWIQSEIEAKRQESGSDDFLKKTSYLKLLDKVPVAYRNFCSLVSKFTDVYRTNSCCQAKPKLGRIHFEHKFIEWLDWDTGTYLDWNANLDQSIIICSSLKEVQDTVSKRNIRCLAKFF